MDTKDAGIRIRVSKQLRQAFVEVCRAQRMGASEVLREFMKGYVERGSVHLAQMPLPLISQQSDSTQ